MIGINGFGRIGRMVCRIALTRPQLQIVAINAPSMHPEYMAYLFKHDSVHGAFHGTITFTEKQLILNGQAIDIYQERDPAKIPWRDSRVNYIVEATGQFTTLEKASAHLQGGAEKIIISGPSSDAPTIVMGVNLEQYDPSMQIISNASCTTNCVAPILKLLQDRFGIEDAAITTVHAVTASQKIVDGTSARDYAIGRSGLNNIIPTSTGAMKVLGKIIPELEGRVTGISFRVPVIDVSVADLTVRVQTPITTEILQQTIRDQANSILGFTDEPTVSTDFIGDPHSSIVDLGNSLVLNSHLVKIVAWYDNETGFSERLLDLIAFMAKK